jgi:hypothetical protein
VAATSPATDHAPKVSGPRLAFALFGGILAWLGHLIAVSGLNGWVCRTGQLWPMHAVTAGTLLVALGALWTGWRLHRDTDPAPSIQAARFLGMAAIVINVFNVVMIVAEWVPVLFIHPCAIG